MKRGGEIYLGGVGKCLGRGVMFTLALNDDFQQITEINSKKKIKKGWKIDFLKVISIGEQQCSPFHNSIPLFSEQCNTL